eukprot:768634-Hanusia_phi.AAC.2
MKVDRMGRGGGGGGGGGGCRRGGNLARTASDSLAISARFFPSSSCSASLANSETSDSQSAPAHPTASPPSAPPTRSPACRVNVGKAMERSRREGEERRRGQGAIGRGGREEGER